MSEYMDSKELEGKASEGGNSIHLSNEPVLGAVAYMAAVPTRAETSALFTKAFTYPKDSPERLEAFSKYLKALREEHQKVDSEK